MPDSPNPDSWLVITLEAPSDAQKEALAEGLLDLGGTAVLESGPHVITYVPAPADIPSFITDAERSLQDLSGDRALRIDWRVQQQQDWSKLWKRGLRPRRVGRRLIVAPSWSRPVARPADLVIVVDPEMAFGTGEHATTRAALRLLEQVVAAGDRVLDVGTGSAILAIGAVLLGATDVLAVDSDPDALINARDNVARNNAGAVTLEERTVDASFLAAFEARPCDVVVANILSSVLLPLLPPLYRAVRAGGHCILGGILEEEADELLAAVAGAGFRVVTEDLEDEWWAVLFQRP